MRLVTVRCLLGAALAASSLAVAAGPAHAVSVGLTAFAGPSFPIAQDDNGTGVQFGVRVPIGLVPFISLEPYYARSTYGDATETLGGIEYTRSGYDMDAFGVNAGLGSFGLLPGFPLYPYVGIGSHALSRDGSEDVTDVGYNFGLGFGLPLPAGFSINVRGELTVVDLGDTSRKFIHATANVGYNLWSLP